MNAHAERTVVKSAPELWELADDAELMREWCARLGGPGEERSVVVTRREPRERLAWRDAAAAIELTLSEKGFGTCVTIAASAVRPIAGDTLDSLLDELASPQRRPFARA